MGIAMRLFLLCLGWAMVGIGLVGIFLPLLPTTPFLLLAAWLFSRSSPRLERWLFDHPWFGQPLRDWRRDGAISRRAKICAISLMGLGLLVLWSRSATSLWVATAATAIILLCSLFIASRPEPHR
ncbi:YbaN family protein [Rhizobium binxianense]